MKRKRFAVLDIDRGIRDKKKAVLAEFDTEAEAVEWRSKMKTTDPNPLIKFAQYPIWEFDKKE